MIPKKMHLNASRVSFLSMDEAFTPRASLLTYSVNGIESRLKYRIKSDCSVYAEREIDDELR